RPRVEIAAAPPVQIARAAVPAAPPPRAIGRIAFAPPARHSIALAAYRPPPRHVLSLAADKPAVQVFVQAGAFSAPGNAFRVRARVAGLARVEVSAVAIGGVEVYRVRLGPFSNVKEANRVLSRVIDSGFRGARMVFD
ncbi:MAG TPA: SPOR domain-containing protein, partial [Stellaceae bacterium]|nr:SPOR domain-containing protein [Stellaceae bacterium]